MPDSTERETILVRAKLHPSEWRALRKQAIDAGQGTAEHAGLLLRLGLTEWRRRERERNENPQ